ncbi:MAG: peptide chain release factor N(5)-glutamine methyltransferase [Myxococcaceae bacterium]|jgi:release factor glutamine methyltransferase|nr:peptide chain release factor N(5)-glutamine methyltransferase [Myxococcaceae bacterium]
MSDEQPDVEAVYARGSYAFMGLELLVSRGALVPRKETELLATEAISLARQAGPAPLVIDVCCGSGNLACAIAQHVPASRVLASDLTDGCFDLASKNVAHLGLSGRVSVFQGDLFAPVAAHVAPESVDVIVCNPPYISTGRLAADSRVLLENEPREAFDGGPYGLSIHQRVIKEAPALLKPGGFLLFEFGLGQERQMSALFARAKTFADLRFAANAAGAPRVAIARRT